MPGNEKWLAGNDRGLEISLVHAAWTFSPGNKGLPLQMNIL